ncbi:hypothetical protein YTPLAS72_28200 [Nitrospira sp.]|nr:hypothetical protein YTPLAS72_28200 [Nitrospira sp.]
MVPSRFLRRRLLPDATVFLSYSRADVLLIEQLEAQLKGHPEISIWRDQEQIYGGQKWPKVLGAIVAKTSRESF